MSGIQRQCKIYRANEFIATVIMIFCNSFEQLELVLDKSPYHHTPINNGFCCMERMNSFLCNPLPLYSSQTFQLFKEESAIFFEVTSAPFV